MGLLESGTEDAQDRAAQCLWRIVKENPGQEMLIAKAGGPEPLVRLLSSKRSAAQAYALWSLSLCIDEENQKIVAEAGGIVPLVDLLRSTKDGIVHEQSACAIKRLAGNKCATASCDVSARWLASA